MKTPQQTHPKLAKLLGIQSLYLKREDQHPYGSHKGRSIPPMIKYYVKFEDIRHFCISSSGNAALAAAIAVQKHNKNNPDKQIELDIFIGEKIPEKKQKKLSSCVSKSISLKKVERPKQEAFLFAKDDAIVLLRQSTDDQALRGYADLAKELSKIPNLTRVFVPSSSGTTAQALAQYMIDNELNITIDIVQTTSCHTLVDAIKGSSEAFEEESLAGAIVDRVAHRKQNITELIPKTGGRGIIADNDSITQALKML